VGSYRGKDCAGVLRRQMPALAALGCLGAVALPVPGAFAACAPATGSNITVTCSGVTVNQGPGINTGYGDGTQNGLTVNVQSGASVTGTNTGIDVNANTTINNFGTITTAGNDIYAINANGVQLTVNNSGSIGNVNDLAGINSANFGLTVTNNASGVISGQTAIQGAGAGGVGTTAVTNFGLIQGLVGIDGGSGFVSVTNNASGIINGDAIAINNTAYSVNVTNSGTISTTAGFSGNAISAGTAATVTNLASGIITADGNAITAPTITVTNFGSISGTGFAASGIFGGSNVTVTNSGSISGSVAAAAIAMGSGTITNNAGATIVGDTGIAAFNNTTIFNAGTITGNAGNAINFLSNGNTLTIAPTSVIVGNVLANSGDTFQLGGTGPGSFDLGTIGPAQQYRGFTTFNKVGSSTWTVTGTGNQAWTVQSGKFLVDGNLAAGSGITVNAGGTLGGTGTLPTALINAGGIFAPGSGVAGSTMTVAGNLAFQSGAIYLVQINAAGAASRADVTGHATLAGATVNVIAAPGTYTPGQTFTILHANGGFGGTQFSGVSIANFAGTLSYTPTDVILSLSAALGAGTALNQNQQSVAGAISNFSNSGGVLPANFSGLFGLTGGNLANALTLLSGEAATGAQQGAFQLTSQFLSLMLDPFVDGRGGFGGAGGGAIGFAPERPALPDEIALAYASVMKAPAYKAPPFEQRWSVWGAAYGGFNNTAGDPAVVGSHDLIARAGGFAAGMDYRVAPETFLGFALAGAGTNWTLAQGLGGGKSDAFQAGVYGSTRFGPAYVAASLAFTNHWMTTDRVAFAGDHLTAGFNAQSFGARAEGGYRIASAFGALAPYAAVQAQSFHTPTYTETDVNGGGFGLTYDGRTASDTRSELGARFDKKIMVDPKTVLALRARLAWAHDWITDPSLAAVFQALPGAAFIVNGATPAKDSALASAGAELRLANGVSLLGKFDGEFARRASTYAGTGTVRVSW
jgi:uncharacterized protein with beta-barrel porin domain